MTPWDLAKDSEHSQQVALFCYCAKAEKVGFAIAKDPIMYTNSTLIGKVGISSKAVPVPELAFLHAIPNGGNRGDNAKSRSIEGGRMKAEGVKPGVLDIFWPLAAKTTDGELTLYCGLYIEMKKPSLKNEKNPQAGCSDAQREFGQFCINQGYSCHVCYTWLEAAEILEWYYNL